MNDLINDIIRKYQNKPGYMFDSLDEFNSIAVPNLQDYKQETEAHNPIDELNYAPDKSAINYFQSSYRHAFCLLGINSNEEETEQSLFHDLGKTLINWLILGERINVGGLLTIVKHECRRLFNTTAWYEKRWESIQAALIGDYESSLKHEEESLEIAKKEGLATWVINDILIDCRNAKIRIDNNSHVYYDDNKAQEELNLQDTIINLPVLDRYLSNTYGSIVNEEFKIETSPHGTVFYGTRLHDNITNTLNYYFSAILYGSYTHMLKSREILANVLYKYAGILEDNHLYFRAIELLLLLGDEKKCSNLINNKWDIIYSYYSCHADDIWTLTEKVSIEHRDSIRIMVLTELGAYFSDTVFSDAEKFLWDYSRNVYWGNSQKYLDCISRNIAWLSPTAVTETISDIILEKKLSVAKKLSDILFQLKLDQVDVNHQKQLHDAIKAQMSFLMQHNCSPQIIAALIKENEPLFIDLKDVPGNKIKGIEKMYFDINMGDNSWENVLIHEIDSAKEQFLTNNTNSSYVFYAHNPYRTIKDIVRNNYTTSLNAPLITSFFPLCEEVLKSQASSTLKAECVDCLCDVLLCAVSLDDVPDTLRIAIRETIPYDNNIGMSKESFTLRLQILQIIIGENPEDTFLEWSSSYHTKEEHERLAIIEGIEQYLMKYEIAPIVYSIICAAKQDTYDYIRAKAVKCLVLILDSKYQIKAEQGLYDAIIDPSVVVRNMVANLCINNKIPETELKVKLLKILSNDANHVTRTYVNKALLNKNY